MPRADPVDALCSQALRVHLLGGFRVRTGARTIEASSWRLRKAQTLIKQLALAPGHRLHREQLLDALWPDLDPKAAANNLHRALYIARRTVEPDGATVPCLQVRGEVVSLGGSRPLWVDVEAFEQAAARARQTNSEGDLQAALELYGGDLLPEDPYADWCAARREALRQAHQSLLVRFASVCERTEADGPAADMLVRALALDPAWEDGHVALMRLHAVGGRTGEALRQYGRLRSALRRDLDASPQPGTERLVEEIRAGRFPASGLSPPRPAAAVSPEPRVDRSSLPTNLPPRLTSFVGRQRELAEIRRLMTRGRLITLTGPGGCGKTRLALEAASGMAPHHADGAWWVDLAPLDEPSLVAQAVATAIGRPELASRAPGDRVVRHLGSRHLLLLLDNCEHLVAGVARLAEDLLGRCPHVYLLATSREPLRVPGEICYRVPSLSLPDPERLIPADELAEYEAVRLFVERATATRSDFELNATTAADVLALCRHLDGMPLAIELAAARVGALTVGEIAARVGDSLDLLSGGWRTALTRQQTLRATLAWSYDLLSAEEQALLRGLAAFTGGFTLDAAERVVAGPGLERSSVAPVLAQLVDKSLVQVEIRARTARYRLLEIVRQFAANHLDASGDSAAVRERHCAWCLDLMNAAAHRLWTAEQTAWVERLESEHANLDAALAWCVACAPARGLQIAGVLWQFWFLRGYLAKGRRWLGDLLARAPEPTILRARALLASAVLAVRQGGEPAVARRLAEESRAVYRLLKNRHGYTHTTYCLSLFRWLADDYAEAEALMASRPIS